MQRHKWSQQDYALLKENVEKYGLTSGAEKTAEILYLTKKGCIAMYKYKFGNHDMKKKGITVTHPEKLENVKVVETTKKEFRKWSDEELELLKANMMMYGFKKGNEKTSERLGRTYHACQTKASLLIQKGFDHGHRRHISLAEKEDEITEFFKKRISENPNNLKEVFREGAKKFNCSVKSMEARWYGFKINNTDFSKYPSCRKNIGHVYTVLGTNATINGKNQAKPDIMQTKGLFCIVKGWFKNIFKV